MKWTLFIAIGAGMLTAKLLAADQIAVVDGPDVSQTNRFYVSNREPLVPSRFISLPVGSIQPRGWLRAVLERERDGLAGHLGEISVWLQKGDNAWLSKDGKGKYGWEELPYWLRGYIEMAYLFDDPKMISESQVWIEGVLASQRPNGDFGPDQRFEDGTRDYWANMLMMYCLESYYEHSHDQRVLTLMTRYFKYQLTVPDNQMLTGYWQKMRGGDNLYAIYWLYNHTGDPMLLETAAKIHRCTADWELKNDLPNWHNVNIAESFREPATFYLQSHDDQDLRATYADFAEVRKRYGQVPGGMFGGDENCRPGYSDPRQGIETCGEVEQMLSDELLMQITGDPRWADNCEDVAFNTYPAALTPDMRALRYLTAPNMVVSDGKNHAPGIDNGGPFLLMNPFSSRCCQHNHSMGWPYFSKHLWLATPDNGICAAIYSASEAKAQVGDGATVRITEETHYPFEDKIDFKLAMDKSTVFPFYLRVPGWCKNASLAINGEPAKIAAVSGKYVRVEREWRDGDTVAWRMPMEISVRHWEKNHDSVSVNYGPLTFSLKIAERYDRVDSTRTAIGDSGWQKTADASKWPSFEIHPNSPWNFGLVSVSESSFKIERRAWPANDYPFTPDSAPIWLETKARQIPEWTVDRFGLCATLQESPAWSTQDEQSVDLVPMGAARLRIASFPTVSEDAGAHHWEPAKFPKPPKYKISASHVYDSLDAMADELIPQSSADESIPRFTWWPHVGTTEWVQYDFDHPQSVLGVAVYWFDDTGHGRCRVPGGWKVLFKDGDDWKPVTTKEKYATERDRFNRVSFDPVQTAALRIEVSLRPDFSGGILEWQVVE
jgi:hypothetical protein